MTNAAPKKKLPVAKLVIAAVVLVFVAGFLLRGFNIRGAIDRGMVLIQEAGPVIFFTAMALVPVLPVPMLAFTLTAGRAFGPTLGMPLVIVLCMICVTANYIFTYSLARWVLHPFVERIMKRLGYAIPEVPAGDVTDLIVIFRVTPGIPFVVQNYLLGLAKIPFGRYVVVSFLTASIPSIAYVIFGDGLLHGEGRMIMVGLGSIVAIVAVTHLVRKHYGKKKSRAS